jgi:hypothetical protein
MISGFQQSVCQLHVAIIWCATYSGISNSVRESRVFCMQFSCKVQLCTRQQSCIALVCGGCCCSGFIRTAWRVAMQWAADCAVGTCVYASNVGYVINISCRLAFRLRAPCICLVQFFLVFASCCCTVTHTYSAPLSHNFVVMGVSVLHL